jgi:predicted RNA-binding Zn-ribbon protein involved in translation (DUF1610 family)
MTYEEFWHETYSVLWPAQYKLYYVFHDPDKERIKLTKESFHEIFGWIVAESSGNAPQCYGVIYSFDHSNSTELFPLMKLTAENLRRLGSVRMMEDEAESEEIIEDNDTESVQTQDSKLQREMNTEVTYRDSNICVLCRRHAGDVDLQAAHIFEVRQRKKMTIQTWLTTKWELKIDSLYGPKNGWSECTLCHKMHDRKLLSVECVAGTAEYRIRCEPGALEDPLFAYREHAININGQLVLAPTNAALKLHWPEPELVMWRDKIHVQSAVEKAADESTYSFECPECGKLYKMARHLLDHYRGAKCDEMRASREHGKYGGFTLVRIPNETRRKASVDAILSKMESSGL